MAFKPQRAYCTSGCFVTHRIKANRITGNKWWDENGNTWRHRTEIAKTDLIVLDVAMPRMNGVEAASVLKGMMPDVPIVWFIMYKELMGHSLTAAVGVDAVLSKPDGVGDIVECVQGLLN